LFEDPLRAGLDALEYLNRTLTDDDLDWEHCGSIYQCPDGKWTYTDFKKGEKRSACILPKPPAGLAIWAGYHNHTRTHWYDGFLGFNVINPETPTDPIDYYPNGRAAFLLSPSRKRIAWLKGNIPEAPWLDFP
jgi:hypothetical protein